MRSSDGIRISNDPPEAPPLPGDHLLREEAGTTAAASVTAGTTNSAPSSEEQRTGGAFPDDPAPDHRVSSQRQPALLAYFSAGSPSGISKDRARSACEALYKLFREEEGSSVSQLSEHGGIVILKPYASAHVVPRPSEELRQVLGAAVEQKAQSRLEGSDR